MKTIKIISVLTLGLIVLTSFAASNKSDVVIVDTLETESTFFINNAGFIDEGV